MPLSARRKKRRKKKDVKKEKRREGRQLGGREARQGARKGWRGRREEGRCSPHPEQEASRINSAKFPK